MTSKDDDTLPLPGFSQELLVDATVDEDFIPTTQPQSSDGSKVSKNSDSKYLIPAGETKSSHDVSKPSIEGILPSKIDQSGLEEDKSVDFIPDTETKKKLIDYSTEDFSWKKKLPVFDAEDSFKDQSNASWDRDMSKMSESPALDTQNFSIVTDTPTQVSLRSQEPDIKREESVTEIIVNDSAETVDLEQTPMRVKQSEREVVQGKLEDSCSLNSDVERSQETQLFDYSSVLLLDQPQKSERFSGLSSEKSDLHETVDVNLENGEVQNAEGGSLAGDQFLQKKNEETVPKVNGNSFPSQETQENSEPTSGSIVIRKVDFKLSVSCSVTINTKTNKVLQKTILNVDEIPKFNPKSFHFEAVSDNASDKSKRQSTSSSGSVYSDKTGLPFALPKRISVISDQTDSSEEDFAFFPKRDRRMRERIPWCNEYLLPLKMDDIVQGFIDNQDFLKRSNNVSSPRKPKGRHGDRVKQLKEIPESSSSERLCILETNQSLPVVTEKSDQTREKEETESSRESVADDNKQSGEGVEEKAEKESDENVESAQCFDKEKQAVVEGSERNHLDPVNEPELEDKSSSIVFCKDLPVLARWSDGRYYSGVLSGTVKNDRWDVKFDDGASKMVKEDFIIPTEWLKVGALVFALLGDEYESGQIVDIKEGNRNSYVVEFDSEKKRASVNLSDLRLTNVLAGIIREKYKPMKCFQRRKSDIDFDNILTGKRAREQKTPLKVQGTLEIGNSRGKDKSSSKARKKGDQSLDEIKDTPQKKRKNELRGLKSENGHLVEDKVISADSPSGNEALETPRGNSKTPKRAAKPRNLSYDIEEPRSAKSTSKSYLRADGTPVPGTSGVKFKKQKVKANNPDSSVVEETTAGSEIKKPKNDSSKAPPSTEKSKRKRKLDESMDENAKTEQKEGNSKPKRKTRN